MSKPTNTTKVVNVSKTVLPVTKQAILDALPQVTVTVQFGDNTPVTLTADGRDFKTGSIGYYISEKIMTAVNVDGKQYGIKVQAGMNLTVVGSKDSA